MGSQSSLLEVEMISYGEALVLAKASRDGLVVTHWLACAAQDLARRLQVECCISTTLQSIGDRNARTQLLTRGGHHLCLEAAGLEPLVLLASCGDVVRINKNGEVEAIGGRSVVDAVARMIRIYLIAARRRQTRNTGSCPP